MTGTADGPVEKPGQVPGKPAKCISRRLKSKQDRNRGHDRKCVPLPSMAEGLGAFGVTETEAHPQCQGTKVSRGGRFAFV